MTGRGRERSRAPRFPLRFYVNHDSVRAYGRIPAGEPTHAELVGFSPSRVTGPMLLHLSREVLSRAHLAASVEFHLRDTDPQIAEHIAVLLRAVGVVVTVAPSEATSTYRRDRGGHGRGPVA